MNRALLIALCVMLLPGIVQAKNHALLVGVGKYSGQPLEGPIHDVAALNSVLQEKWGFHDSEISILLDEAATKNAILAGIDALYARTEPGDNVFLYLSGHGTSREDRLIKAPLPTTSGAFIPFDVEGVRTREELMKRLVIGRNDLKPRFKQFDDNGRHLFVAIDACYSGNTVRGAGRVKKERLPTRHLSLSQLLPRGFGDDLRGSVTDWSKSDDKEDVYPYTNTFYLGASGEHEKAEDIPARLLKSYKTIDNKPHGAFTNSLLEVLHEPERADLDKSGYVSYAELRQSLKERMGERGFNHTPQGLPTIDQDHSNLALRQVFLFDQSDASSEYELPAVVPAAAVEAAVATVTEAVAVATSGLVSAAAVTATASSATSVIAGSGVPVVSSNSDQVVASEEKAKRGEASFKVKLHPFAQSIKQEILALPGIVLTQEAFSLEIVPSRNEGFMLLSNSGDVIARYTNDEKEELIAAVKYQKWLVTHLATAKTNSSAWRLQAGISGLAKGSTVVDGELLGFDINLPDGGYLMILDYEPGGYINVIYPYSPNELSEFKSGSKVRLHELMRVSPPYGKDSVQVVALKELNETYKKLPYNTRFYYESSIANSLVEMMQSTSPKASHSLQLVTAARSE